MTGNSRSSSSHPPSIQDIERRIGSYFLLPAVLVLVLVFGYPILRSFWLGFFAQNLGTGLEPVFIGLDNYVRIAGDGHFWQTFWNTVRFTVVSVTLELMLGLAIALALNTSFRGRGTVRTIAIIPWALPTALIALAWTWIFNDQYGVANDILLRLGLTETGVNWLGQPVTANVAIIIADVWKTTPFISILLLAGLQAIPQDLYEAHALDGASPWQSFVNITLPLLMPQILVATLFRVAQAFGIYDLIQVMTAGGPGGSTEMIALYIYANAMRYLDFGYASAQVVVTFLLLAIAILGFSLLFLRQRSTQQ
ncbi:MAG: sugar ABC transporter permease [Synechococcales cyanobacterium T60_A2020_003]|nr:sugar ABC transporter permease [Synechococcales cyanobacterium T60_A2020_003]